ncbi:hypothetical protein [Cellulophaga sp. BC115SP]|uniref:hypothetical protein n=1 Tax=Cellulophaga sp. BC115SP TaxID=2683263 RepID=UPI0014136117|nr:hypothetical protein [Cellulophaga sp. BC115SP]NBB31762.1 hypothetical protein [Cellulophaga sp. BC115SP]
MKTRLFTLWILCLWVNVGVWSQTTVAISPACKDCPATITALSCAVASAGTLQEGTPIGVGVTQTVQATVSKTGNYTLTTTANGITFSASGTFTTTGNQNVTLTATGVPIVAETTTFNLSYGTVSCTFTRVVGASGSKIASFGPTNLRFKQLGIQWGLTLDGDVYGWNGALEGKTLGTPSETITKSMTLTKVQNQPGKIAKISCALHDLGSVGFSVVNVFMVGVDGQIYTIEPHTANVLGSYYQNWYVSPVNLTLIGDAGSGVFRTGANYIGGMQGERKMVIRRFPASPSGQAWKDIAPLSEPNIFAGSQTYALLGIDAAGRMFAATATQGVGGHNTSWKELPKPTGSTAAFQYVKFVDTDVNQRTGFGNAYLRTFVAEGNDGAYYVFRKDNITSVAHATAFSATPFKKIPLPAGKVLRTYRFYQESVSPESKGYLITTDGSLYDYTYSTNAITEVTKPKPTTQFIDIWDNVAVTNEGVYERGPTTAPSPSGDNRLPLFSWKVNMQFYRTPTPAPSLAGNWRAPRPENDYGTLFQQIAYTNIGGDWIGGLSYIEGNMRTQRRALMLDATGKAYWVIRTDFNYMHYTGVHEPGFYDGETGMYVTELMNGKYDDNNPYPEP